MLEAGSQKAARNTMGTNDHDATIWIPIQEITVSMFQYFKSFIETFHFLKIPAIMRDLRVLLRQSRKHI